MAHDPSRISPLRAEMVSPSTMRLYTSTGYTDVRTNEDGSVTYTNVAFASDGVRARNAHMRDAFGRAPLGDSHGAWQPMGEFSLAAWRQYAPIEAIEDDKAVARWLNDSDRRDFRATKGKV